MTNCEGYELSAALSILEKEGYKVQLSEVRSRKGVADCNSKRVVRQIPIDEHTVGIVFSCIKDTPTISE